MIDEDGFELAARALEVFDEDRAAALWFIAARRCALRDELTDALDGVAATVAAVERAERDHAEALARVAALRAAVLDLDASAPPAG